jgi:hypothetical protein
MAQGWLRVCGVQDDALAKTVEDRVAERRARNEFTQDEQWYIRDVSLAVSKGTDFFLSGERSELLRRMCALHKMTLHPRTISSHRPVVGKIIVGAKQAIFRIMKPLLEPMLRQQTTFNACMVTLVAQLANEAKSPSKEETK